MKTWELSIAQYYHGIHRRIEKRQRIMARLGYHHDSERHAYVRRFRGTKLYVVPVQAAWHAPKRLLFEVILPGTTINLERAAIALAEGSAP